MFSFVLAIVAFAAEDDVQTLEQICVDCLAGGQDYCIASGQCAPRNESSCDGDAYDHITGSEELSNGTVDGRERATNCEEAEPDFGIPKDPKCLACLAEGRVWQNETCKTTCENTNTDNEDDFDYENECHDRRCPPTVIVDYFEETCESCISNGGTWQEEAGGHDKCQDDCDIKDISCVRELRLCPEATPEVPEGLPTDGKNPPAAAGHSFMYYASIVVLIILIMLILVLTFLILTTKKQTEGASLMGAEGGEFGSTESFVQKQNTWPAGNVSRVQAVFESRRN